MPTVPSNGKCAQLGCKNPRSKCNSFCLEHGGYDIYKQQSTEERNRFNSMYQTRFWKAKRIAQLSSQPLCQSCLAKGIVTPAIHIDHVWAWNSLGKDAFYANWFQSLCHECHSHKTSLEAKGIYRHYMDGIYMDYQIADYYRLVKV